MVTVSRLLLFQIWWGGDIIREYYGVGSNWYSVIGDYRRPVNEVLALITNPTRCTNFSNLFLE